MGYCKKTKKRGDSQQQPTDPKRNMAAKKIQGGKEEKRCGEFESKKQLIKTNEVKRMGQVEVEKK